MDFMNRFSLFCGGFFPDDFSSEVILQRQGKKNKSD
jgi:hypothetical protein